MKTNWKERSQELVQEFISLGYPEQPHLIPNNRVFRTDITTSTLVWWKENVVIEFYMLFPDVEVKNIILHTHPFSNQVISLAGELITARVMSGDTDNYRIRRERISSGEVSIVKLLDKDHGRLSSIVDPPFMHGFGSGSQGALFYNIQIWQDDVLNPTSASVEYGGQPLGSVHKTTISQGI